MSTLVNVKDIETIDKFFGEKLKTFSLFFMEKVDSPFRADLYCESFWFGSIYGNFHFVLNDVQETLSKLTMSELLDKMLVYENGYWTVRSVFAIISTVAREDRSAAEHKLKCDLRYWIEYF